MYFNGPFLFSLMKIEEEADKMENDANKAIMFYSPKPEIERNYAERFEEG